MSAVIRWLFRFLLAALSLSRLARAAAGRLASGPPPRSPDGPASAPSGAPDGTPAPAFRRAHAGEGDRVQGAESGRLGDPVGVVRGRLALRSSHGGSARVKRDMALVGGLLVVGAVAGYALTAALGGAAGTPSRIAGQASPTPAASAAQSAIVPTPPLTGGSASPGVAVPTSPPPSVTPSITPALPAPGPPAARLSTVLGRGGLPFVEIRWAAVDGGRYELALADLADGEWQRVRLERPREPRILLAVAADRAYRTRVRAVTGAGTSAWVESQGFALRVVDDAARAVAYEGAWAMAGHPLYEAGAARYTRASGATAIVRFVGRSIAWRGPIGPGRGVASVLADGERVARIDATASTFQARRILFVRSWSEAGQHSLGIVVAGTPGRPLVAIDAFYILETVAE